jgi:lysyl-tRNA synthetase class 2
MSTDLSLSDEEKTRREKLNAYRAKGINPYRNGLSPKNSVAELRAKYGEKTKEELEATKIQVSYAGRIMAFRHFGKAAFVQLKDRDGVLQSYVAIQDLGDESFGVFKTYDVGDIVYVEGHMFRTKTNELSVHAARVELLTKALKPLPEKFHGLTDIEQKYRMRYVDLVMNDDTRKVFQMRSRSVSSTRLFRSGNADDASNCGRRGGAPVQYTSQCARYAFVPADRAGAVSEAPTGRRHGEGVRDQSQLPQRRHLDSA